MDIPITLGILLTFILPFINAGIQKVTWSPTQKNLVALVTSAIFAIVYLFLTGGVDWSNVPLAIAACYGLSQAIYAFFVKNIATKFEAITSPGSVVVSPSAEPGKVDITSDTTIEDSKSGSAIEVDPPVQLITTEAPSEPAKPVEITKEDNVVG
jgi:hypothetical protein